MPKKKFTGYVYLIWNDCNDMKYIGITTKWIGDRLTQHLNSKYNNKFAKAIRDIGKHNFNIKLLAKTTSVRKLKLLEQEYIKKFDSINNGYNTKKGGSLGYMKEGIEVVYKGKSFRSKTEAAKFYNISIPTLSSRLKKGIPLEKKETRHLKKSIIYNKIKFSSMSSLSEYLNVPLSSITYRLQNNISLDEPWNNEIEYKGKIYKSIKDMARKLNIPPPTVYSRIQAGRKPDITSKFDPYKNSRIGG